MPASARDLAHPAARRSDFGGRGPGSLGDRTRYSTQPQPDVRAPACARELYLDLYDLGQPPDLYFPPVLMH